MIPAICEKGYRNHTMTEEHENGTRDKSKTRCRVDYVFGFVERTKNGFLMLSIGMIRAKAASALTCFVYSFFRYEQLCRCQLAMVKLTKANVQFLYV